MYLVPLTAPKFTDMGSDALLMGKKCSEQNSFQSLFQSDAQGFLSSETSSISELSTWRTIHSPGMSDCEKSDSDSNGIMAVSFYELVNHFWLYFTFHVNLNRKSDWGSDGTDVFTAQQFWVPLKSDLKHNVCCISDEGSRLPWNQWAVFQTIRGTISTENFRFIFFVMSLHVMTRHCVSKVD